MGTNCAPLLADLFLYSYESEFLQKLVKDKKIHEARAFNFTYRYIDDVLSINNSRFAEFLPLIYPPELEVKETTDTASSASFLDLYLEFDDSGQLSTKIYDKREQSYKGKVKTHNYINRQNQSTTENCENRNDPDLVQAFLKKWWVESDFKAPNRPLSLRFKGSGCHCNSI